MPISKGVPALPGRRFRNDAERRAAWWYRLRGYRVLATNVWLAGNELDVVARRGGQLVFCEVKSKSGRGFGLPEEMVGREKQRRLFQAAEAWLAQQPSLGGVDVEFEVLAVEGRELRRIPLGDPL